MKQAMSQLVRQAGENDNIMTIYVVDPDECFAGAIDLKDLITAREGMNLESIIAHSYPYVLEHEKIDDCIDTIKDHAAEHEKENAMAYHPAFLWNNGTCISGNICASVQGLHMAWSICGIRLCRSFTACGNGNFKPCGHSDSDVFPQDKD